MAILKRKGKSYENWLLGENPLRCTTHDKNDLVLIVALFTLYFYPHKK